jgi:hypothetical protein
VVGFFFFFLGFFFLFVGVSGFVGDTPM